MTRLHFYRYLKNFIRYSSAPIFLLIGLYSTFISHRIAFCSSNPYEMQLMWYLMCFAHLKPWIEHIEIKFCPKGCG